MDSRQTSDDLLAHFDRPKILKMPDFEWVEEAIPSVHETVLECGGQSPDRAAERFVEVPLDTPRGIGWVLAWAGALAVFAIATGVLAEFTYVFAAERALAVAARAGAMEATLPRATYQSVTAAVDRRLNQYPLLAKRLHLSLVQNGAPVQSQLRRKEGDRFAVTLSGPTSAAVPDWLRTLVLWRGESAIQAHAEQHVPGRRLAYRAGSAARN